MFSAFLIGSIDKLVVIRRYLDHSYLNTVEKCMTILNLGLANLTMCIDPKAPDYLFDLLWDDNLMKQVK